MGTGTPRHSPEAASGGEASSGAQSSPAAEGTDGAEGPDEQEMFSRIMKPRVRYDVEVVTKLIVYSGKHRGLSDSRGAIAETDENLFPSRHRHSSHGGGTTPVRFYWPSLSRSGMILHYKGILPLRIGVSWLGPLFSSC